MEPTNNIHGGIYIYDAANSQRPCTLATEASSDKGVTHSISPSTLPLCIVTTPQVASLT